MYSLILTNNTAFFFSVGQKSNLSRAKIVELLSKLKRNSCRQWHLTDLCGNCLLKFKKPALYQAQKANNVTRQLQVFRNVEKKAAKKQFLETVISKILLLFTTAVEYLTFQLFV